MSEYFYDYKCPKCGHVIHEVSKGGLLFGDYESDIYVCNECGNVNSISLKYDAPDVITSKPKCPNCGGDVETWHGKCPKCGTQMEEILLYDIVM